MSKQKFSPDSMASLAVIKTQKLEVPQYLKNLNLSIQDAKAIRNIISETKQRSNVVMDSKFSSGLFVLLTGENGTAKLSTSALIANNLNSQLYRINLSLVVSKYIGETEKNLNRIFDAAQGFDTILFFDEADALFGKRTGVKNSHDRYANIEISYLLQKMKEYKGLMILAANNKDLDETFLRKLRYKIEFPFPKAEQRENIWDKLFNFISNIFKKKIYVMVADVDGSTLKGKEA